MALNLNIPKLQDNPLMVAETKPSKISASLEILANNSAIDFGAHLRSELNVLNRQKMSASTRIQALNVYRKSTLNTVHLLAQDFSNASLPLHDKAKLAAHTTLGLWQELGYGYKLALIDLQNQLISLGRNKETIYVIDRAMHAVTEQALIYFQTYTTLPSHIWEDIYQLYFCAVQLGVQHEHMLEGELNIWSNTYIPFSIENAFKHALLMFLANPQNLTQQEIRMTAEYLAHHVRDAEVTAVTPLSVSYGAFIVNLATNAPPEPYSKQKDAPDPHIDILLQTIELVRTIHSNLSSLQNKQLPIDGSIPDIENKEDYIHLLTHLIKNLGITPKRQFKRAKKYGELELVTGIPASHFLSGSEASDASVALSSEGRVLQSHTNNPIVTSRWQILNMSATGLCIRRHPSAAKNIKIGSLVSFRLKGEHHWSQAAVRWAQCGSRDTLIIGIQLLAPYAQSGILTSSQWDHDEMALFLPQISAVKEHASLIVPKGTYQAGLRVHLKWNNRSHPIIFTKILERASQFERVQFKMS